MAEVRWAAQAREQLTAVGDFVAQESESRAAALVSRLFLAAERLASFPLSGRTVPERHDAKLREIIVGEYRIIYQLHGSDVEVVSVLHGRRLFRMREF